MSALSNVRQPERRTARLSGASDCCGSLEQCDQSTLIHRQPAHTAASRCDVKAIRQISRNDTGMNVGGPTNDRADVGAGPIGHATLLGNTGLRRRISGRRTPYLRLLALGIDGGKGSILSVGLAC